MIKVALIMSANIRSIYCDWNGIEEDDFSDVESEECLDTIMSIYDAAIESIDESHEVENEDGETDTLTGKFYGVKRDTKELFMVRNAQELFDGCGFSHQEFFMEDDESRPELPFLVFESNMLDADTALGDWFLPVSESISYYVEPEYLPIQHLVAYSSICDNISVQSYERGEMIDGVTNDEDCESYSGEKVIDWYGIKTDFFK